MEESISPLPILDNGSIGSDPSCDSSDIDPLDHYVIRVTSHGKFSTEQLLEFIRNEPQIFRYVIGRETVPQEHFHLVVSVDNTVSLTDVKDIVRAFIVPYWIDPVTGKCPRGFGNKQYNIKESTTLDAAISYAVKLGEYWYEGYTEEYILERKAESFEKKKPSDFKSEYRELCNSFQSSDMDIREFMIQMADLKAKYDQTVIMSHIYGYAVGQQIKRDKNASDFVEDYLYNK